MSFAGLKKLVPPPVKPLEVGTLTQWKAVEKKLGTELPEDYREFVFAYGSGLFANLYRVYNPFAASQHTALLPSFKRICGHERKLREAEGDEDFPFPFYPDPGGLLVWGNDENGNDYYWKTDGPPNKWHVVQNANRGQQFRTQPAKKYSMTGFLVAILQGKVKPLASGYPEKEDLKFEPWDTSKFK